MGLKNAILESKIVFEKIDKITSKAFLYYSATFGFIFGWVCLGILFFSMSGTIPTAFIILLRIFYFLLSFLLGLKMTLFFIKMVNKRILKTKSRR